MSQQLAIRRGRVVGIVEQESPILATSLERLLTQIVIKAELSPPHLLRRKTTRNSSSPSATEQLRRGEQNELPQM